MCLWLRRGAKNDIAGVWMGRRTEETPASSPEKAVRYRMSQSKIQELLLDLMGVELSIGVSAQKYAIA